MVVQAPIATNLTAAYGGVTMAFYALICLESLSFTPTSHEVQTILIRLLMIAGVAVCGALYQRVERDRRGGDESPIERSDDIAFS